MKIILNFLKINKIIKAVKINEIKKENINLEKKNFPWSN